MRVNIEFIIICASLVASVAPGWISNIGVDNPNAHDEHPLKSVARRAAESELANISENAEEQTHEALPKEVSQRKPIRNYCTEGVYVYEPGTRIFSGETGHAEELLVLVMNELNEVRCAHQKMVAAEAERAAKAGVEPREIPLHRKYQLVRLLATKKDDADTKIVAQFFNVADLLAAYGFDLEGTPAESPERKIEVGEPESTIADWRGHWRERQQATRQRLNRETGDDVPATDGPKDVADQQKPVFAEDGSYYLRIRDSDFERALHSLKKSSKNPSKAHKDTPERN